VVAGYAEFGYFLYCDKEAQHHDWPEDLPQPGNGISAARPRRRSH
jgi:hypothetical protein